jgi:hypothetical protein
VVNAAFALLRIADFSESLEAPVTQNDVPPPAVVPVPTYDDVFATAHDLLGTIDNVQAHTQPTPYLISARALIVNALSQAEAHFSAIASIVAAEALAQVHAAIVAAQTPPSEEPAVDSWSEAQ